MTAACLRTTASHMHREPPPLRGSSAEFVPSGRAERPRTGRTARSPRATITAKPPERTESVTKISPGIGYTAPNGRLMAERNIVALDGGGFLCHPARQLFEDAFADDGDLTSSPCTERSNVRPWSSDAPSPALQHYSIKDSMRSRPPTISFHFPSPAIATHRPHSPEDLDHMPPRSSKTLGVGRGVSGGWFACGQIVRQEACRPGETSAMLIVPRCSGGSIRPPYWYLAGTGGPQPEILMTDGRGAEA